MYTIFHFFNFAFIRKSFTKKIRHKVYLVIIQSERNHRKGGNIMKFLDFSMSWRVNITQSVIF